MEETHKFLNLGWLPPVTTSTNLIKIWDYVVMEKQQIQPQWWLWKANICASMYTLVMAYPLIYLSLRDTICFSFFLKGHQNSPPVFTPKVPVCCFRKQTGVPSAEFLMIKRHRSESVITSHLFLVLTLPLNERWNLRCTLIVTNYVCSLSFGQCLASVF